MYQTYFQHMVFFCLGKKRLENDSKRATLCWSLYLSAKLAWGSQKRIFSAHIQNDLVKSAIWRPPETIRRPRVERSGNVWFAVWHLTIHKAQPKAAWKRLMIKFLGQNWCRINFSSWCQIKNQNTLTFENPSKFWQKSYSQEKDFGHRRTSTASTAGS